MTQHDRDFDLNRPGALIAALPAVLGFVPERSLVLVSIDRGQMGAVMRVDLCAELADRVGHLVEVAAAAASDAPDDPLFAELSAKNGFQEMSRENKS